MKRSLIIFLFSLTSATSVSGQNLAAFNLDASGFPIMKAQFLAFDVNGVLQSPQPSSFTILENGVPRTVTAVNCPISQNPNVLSVALVIDVSGSVTKIINGITNETLEQQGTSAFVSALNMPASECSFTTFDQIGHLHHDFSTDRALMLNAIGELNPDGGTDYNYAFQKPIAGGLFMTSAATHKPIVIMSTDGLSDNPTQTAAIIAEAKTQNCTIYCIALRMNCPQELKDISTQTGGTWFENIFTTQQIEDTYLRILGIAEGLMPCEVTWQSDVSCDTVSRFVQIAWSGDHQNFIYTPPGSAFAKLQFNPPTLVLASKPIGIPLTWNITATAINSAFTITNVSSTNPQFDINPKSVTIARGINAPFALTYTPTDSGYSWTDFTFTTDKCTQHYYVSGGYPGKKPKIPTLKVLSPNGGEQLPVGSDTAIYWTGISPDDAVKLEYTTDDGTTWNTITSSITGSRYPWHVPNAPSASCLIRATQVTPSILQQNTSNALFSIVLPNAISKDVDMLGLNINDYKDSLFNKFIQNQGSYPMHVDSITITGVNASEFALESGFPPFDVPAGGSYDVEFSFHATALGVQNATLGIYTSGISGTPLLTQKIRGNVVSPISVIVDSIIDFGTEVVGRYKDSLQAVTITNISSSPLNITKVHKSFKSSALNGAFKILTDTNGFILNPGNTARVDFRFAPYDSERVAAEVFFDLDSMYTVAEVQLLGKGIVARADLAIGDASGYPGDQVNIPILLLQSQNIAAAGITNFTPTLSFNSSLLYPLDSTPIGTVKGMVRTIPLTIPASPSSGNILTTLPFRVMLGTDTVTKLTLGKDTATGGTATLSDSSGVFHLLGTCTQGGARLYDPAGQVSMAHNPNPANGIIHIDIQTTELGRTRLGIMNLLGAKVATISDGELKPGAHSFWFDSKNLSAGSYFLLLETPTVRRLERVDIEK